ncbi:uncharacterized protein K452DRAFT_64128 [Aplosporella prunicola CBS 121167]|uniref:Uncharacterized protein n=1 Tax=Aplosporella prunicola CBS 121167 TaxID=1176127 RepID=A0A6A6B901_9PEZI|nr:uncharacterized protein K452DRAFT_64128 [Aplosporella prunicola CBS 121167]KAF2139684.1 hypothetical protein K452DRAFT_64128 [Aplosporella prunicola CBS 121167]
MLIQVLLLPHITSLHIALGTSHHITSLPLLSPHSGIQAFRLAAGLDGFQTELLSCGAASWRSLLLHRTPMPTPMPTPSPMSAPKSAPTPKTEQSRAASGDDGRAEEILSPASRGMARMAWYDMVCHG